MGELEGPAWGASRLWFDSSGESGSVSCPVVVVVVVVLLLGIGFLAMVVSSSDASWFDCKNKGTDDVKDAFPHYFGLLVECVFKGTCTPNKE